MALNWGDVALNLTAGAIEKDEVYRKEQLEQRFKELQDNKELYRALATTRYSKDLDKYYKESEKYSNLKDVYNQIQSANSGKGMNKELAARKIIFSDPELFAEWNSYGTTKTGLAARLGMVSQVKSGFKDRTVDGKVVGYEFSHPGLELTSPKQEDYFQTPDYWSNLAKEIESKEMGPLKRQLVKLFRRKENHPAEVDLDTLDQKAGTDIKKLIDNKLYTSSNMDKGTTSYASGTSGILKEEFDKLLDGKNSTVYNDIYNKQLTKWQGREWTNENMYSMLSQMPEAWRDKYLVKENWANQEIRWKEGGELMAQQVRGLWNDIVQFHHDNTFFTEGIFSGEGKALVKNFELDTIMNSFRDEFSRRQFTIENTKDNLFWGPDEMWEFFGIANDREFEVPYIIDDELLPYYEEKIIDGKKKLVKPEMMIKDTIFKDANDNEITIKGLETYLFEEMEDYIASGSKTFQDVRGLEQFMRLKIDEYYKEVLPKEKARVKEEFDEYPKITITEDMIQSQLNDPAVIKAFEKKHGKKPNRADIIKDFQDNPIKEGRKFIFPDDFDLTGEATLEDIRQQEEELNKANKLPFRIDGALTWQEWKDATAREVYDAYIDESPI